MGTTIKGSGFGAWGMERNMKTATILGDSRAGALHPKPQGPLDLYSQPERRGCPETTRGPCFKPLLPSPEALIYDTYEYCGLGPKVHQ